MTTENTDSDWTKVPLPDGLINDDGTEEVHDAIPFVPEDMDESQKTGLQKFMSMALVPHDNIGKEFAYMVKQGMINPIEAFVALKKVGKVLEVTLDSQKGDKELRELILEKVRMSLDGGKSLSIYGADLSIRATGTRYDYTNCNDTYLSKLYDIKKEVLALIKQREDEIKVNLPAEDNKNLGIRTKKVVQEFTPKFELIPADYVDTIVPPIKLSGESVFCTFKKEK